MQQQINDLVKRLSQPQEVESIRPSKNTDSLKECIDRDFVHVMFKKTGTEVGIKLNRKLSDMTLADFSGKTGRVRLIGGLILNYNTVKCTADIDITTCEGTGFLEHISQEQYEDLMK